MAWHEVFKNALYKNNTGCFLKKEKDEFVIFDQEGQLIRIPLIDIFENPVYKYSEFDLKISASENLPILSVNETIFLNGNTLSQVKPETGFIQKIGIAKTANSILLKISDAIIL